MVVYWVDCLVAAKAVMWADCEVMSGGGCDENVSVMRQEWDSPWSSKKSCDFRGR